MTDADRRFALARERDRLVDQVRALDGFGGFLRPPPPADLLAAGDRGPVVVLNASRWRCDALVLADGAVRTVPLGGLTLDGLGDRVGRYLRAVGYPDPDEPDGPAPGIGPHAPGADRPRLWWCPTGLLSLFPLHAAGHHGEPGRSVLDRVVSVRPGDPLVSELAELALFAVLFTDGMHAAWKDLRGAWRLPGRALGWGLPLTLLITALLARYVVGLGWVESLLIAAILTPTDPVFAAALVGNDRVPPRLRHLLNVESGVNDGLVLPFVVLFLAVARGSDDLHLGELGGELVPGPPSPSGTSPNTDSSSPSRPSR
ncbi:cation:proton antiporter [Actinomadura atramentaria]|uniref:cation:proton antiporter domain-containing protein n=1 Tax=Actinomadura atramentaria TaxID=1990 RepID=UPI00039A61A8|nr:cation:proton antiporter [Actinomadura atramentaria]